MAALSRVFRVTAGREWLSVSLLKGELAVSCKTRRRVCLFVFPPLNLHACWMEQPVSYRCSSCVEKEYHRDGFVVSLLQTPGLKAQGSMQDRCWLVHWSWRRCGWLSAAPTLGLAFKESESLVCCKERAAHSLPGCPQPRCKAGGFLPPPC